MLFLPSAISPNSISIDATLNNTFTWQSNGDVQTSYKIQIYRNDTSALIYDSTQIISSTSQHVLPLNSLSNSIDYKYLLTIYSGSNSVVSDYVFIKCNLSPVISMTIPSTVTTQSYTATASYNQANSIPFNSFKFILYDASSNIITDSGWLYGYNLTFSFSGFVSGSSYSIECITRSSYSIQATSGKKPFTVTYVYPNLINTIQGTPLDDSGGVKIDWSSIIQVLGVVTGSSSYVAGKFNQGLYLNPSSSLNYTQTVPITFTMFYWVKLPTGFTGDIISLGTNEYRVGYNGTRFYINYNGSYIHGNLVSLPTNFFRVAVKSNEVIFITDIYTEIIK